MNWRPVTKSDFICGDYPISMDERPVVIHPQVWCALLFAAILYKLELIDARDFYQLDDVRMNRMATDEY